MSIRLVIVGLLALTTLVPWVVAPGFVFPYVTVKALVFRGLVGLAGALAMVEWSSATGTQRTAVRVSTISACVAVLLLWFTAVSTLSEDPTRAFWGSLERMEGLVGIGFLAAYGVLLASFLGAEKRQWLALAKLSVSVSVVVALGAAYAGGPGRWGGWLGSPTFLSLYAVLHGVGALALAGRREQPLFARVGLFAVAGLHAYVLWNTQTRGPLLGLIVACVIAALFTAQCSAKTRTLTVGSLVLVATTAFVALRRCQVFRESDFLWRMGNPQWAGARPALFESATDAIAARPVFGWGVEGLDTALSHHAAAYLPSNMWADRSHSVGLDIAVQGGVPALLLTLVLGAVVLPVVLTPTRSTAEKRWLLASLTAWLVSISVAFADITAWMGLAGILAYLHATSPNSFLGTVTLSSGHNQCRMLALVGLLGLSLLGVDQFRVGSAAHDLARVADVGAPPEHVLAATEAAAARHPMAQVEAAILLAHFADGPRLLERGDVAPQIVRRIEIATTDRPWSVRLAVEHARILAAVGRTDDALSELYRAEHLSSSLASLPLMRVPLYLRQGDVEAALVDAGRAVNLHATDDAIAVLAALYVLTNRLTEATLLLEPHVDKRPAILLDVRLLDAARRTGRTEWLTSQWMVFAEQDRPAFRRKLRAFLWTHPQRH